jgi:hypothetical protein
VPELPHAANEPEVRVARHRQVREIAQGQVDPPLVHIARSRPAAQHREDFQVDQMWDMQRGIRTESVSSEAGIYLRVHAFW